MFKPKYFLYLFLIFSILLMSSLFVSAQEDNMPLISDEVTANIQQNCGYDETRALRIQRILEDINAFRINNERTPLAINSLLCQLARQHTIDYSIGDTYPGDSSLNSDAENIVVRVIARQSPLFISYPGNIYNVSLRTFSSEFASYAQVIANIEQISGDVYENRRTFLLNTDYREIGIGYLESNGNYFYVFILGSQPNKLPIIPFNPSINNIENRNFSSNEVHFWISDERYFDDGDEDIIGQVQRVHVSQSPEQEDCPAEGNNSATWEYYSYPDFIAYQVQGDSGIINLYVQLCDQTGLRTRSQIIPVQVNIQTAPVVQVNVTFEALPDEGDGPLEVTFLDTTPNIPADASYRWDFNGDGTPDSVEQTPIFIYQNAGTYIVTLEILQNDEVLGSAQSTILVTSNSTQLPPPLAQFTASITNCEAPLALAFNNTSTNATEYLWDFDNDGLTDSTEEDPRHTYNMAGNYTVRLTAIGPGGQDNATQIVMVCASGIEDVHANFTVDVAQGTTPLTVNFMNMSEGDVATYEWDFDSDTNIDTTEENPTFTYTEARQYFAELRVIGVNDSEDTFTITINVIPVVPPPPTADFTFAPDRGQAPLIVNFDNTSTGVITGYIWDFNNDGVGDSQDENPSFIFETGGIYTIRLTATGPGGSNIREQEITIAEAPLPTQTPTSEITATQVINTASPTAIIIVETPTTVPTTEVPTTIPTIIATATQQDSEPVPILPLTLTWNSNMLVLTNTTEQDILIEEIQRLSFVQSGNNRFDAGTWFSNEETEGFDLLIPARCLVLFIDNTFDIDPTSPDFPSNTCESVIARWTANSAFWTQRDFSIMYAGEAVTECMSDTRRCVLDYAATFAVDVQANGDLEIASGIGFITIRNISGETIPTDTITQMTFDFGNTRFTGANWSALPQFNPGECLVVFPFDNDTSIMIQGQSNCENQAAYILVDGTPWLDDNFTVSIDDVSQTCSVIGGQLCRLSLPND